MVNYGAAHGAWPCAAYRTCKEKGGGGTWGMSYHFVIIFRVYLQSLQLTIFPSSKDSVERTTATGVSKASTSLQVSKLSQD